MFGKKRGNKFKMLNKNWTHAAPNESIPICICVAAFDLHIQMIDQLTYWVTQKLPQICTLILRICIGKVAWFAVYICDNFWVTQYVIRMPGALSFPRNCHETRISVTHNLYVTSWKNFRENPLIRCYCRTWLNIRWFLHLKLNDLITLKILLRLDSGILSIELA